MLAPQALRAVVRVAASAHKESAPFAGKVLFGALEFSSHHYLAAPPCETSIPLLVGNLKLCAKFL